MDDDLVGRARQGDRKALEQLLEAHLVAVYRYVSTRLGSADSAVEDVVQETLIGAMGSIHRLRGDSEPALVGWLLTIARYKIADHLRHRYRAAETAYDGAAPILASSSAGPEEVAIERERDDALREAMGRLTPDQREVLTLKFSLGYANDEIAGIVGKPVGSVKSLQHRALAALERLITGPGPSGIAAD